MKAAPRPRIPDGGASEVVGNVLMIAVTVTLAATLAYSLASATAPSDPVTADVAIDDRSGVHAEHAGGETIPVEGSSFVLVYEDGDERIPLEAFPGDVSEGEPDAWELGEEVCVSCEASDEIQSLTFVTQGTVLQDWQASP